GGMLLQSLNEIEPAPIQKLVELMGRDKSQMTRLIQMLEGRGYLQRQPSPTDGRVSLLRLTSKGSAFVGEIGVLMSDVIDDVLSPLNAEERDVLASLLRKV
ncbi:MAG: MarR family transcriptional regulator, partial [Pseudomonadota bacterium]